MRVVTDGERHYVLQRVVGAECHVRSIPTGETSTLPASSLSPVAPDDALRTLDADIAADVGSNAAAGLFLELAVDGPASARGLLDQFDVCESDLHGAVSELRAAGLIEPTTVYGERGYRSVIDD